MKVLITGGAGFIGSHLSDKLLARVDNVLIIDNYSTGRRDNLVPHDQLRVVEDTICNKSTIDQLMQEYMPDVVVHAAASYKDPDNWMEDTQTNAFGTAVICQAMQKAGIKRIIYFQTALCYGLKPCLLYTSPSPRD